MIFNSFNYLVFFILVFVFYWIINGNYKWQNILLLISSYIFYAWWDWRFLSLIIFSSFLDYYVALNLYSSITPKKRERWLLVSLFSNLGLLAIFKYYNFFAESFADSMKMLGWEVDNLTLNIILPVGISFYTFQTLSYTIDIYRKQFMPTKNIISFLTYVAFFPQLVAGPIERASNLLPQIEGNRVFREKWFKDGLFQISIGLFRKIVIADNLGKYVDVVYANSEIHNSSTLLLGTFFYAFQIYYDFAGYSDIAIGSAKLLGFQFNQNFNFPYFSKSITEFWRRWHMSLSYWLRDYLYISLGGNRKGIKITYRNLMITMLLGGLWHGSSWNFIIWGGIHGIALSIEKFVFSNRKNLHFNYIGYFYTFSIVLISWVFFRAQDLESAFGIVHTILKFNFIKPFIGNINTIAVSVSMLSLGIFFDFYLFKADKQLEDFANNLNHVRLVVFISIIILLMSLFYATSNNFIYFQF